MTWLRTSLLAGALLTGCSSSPRQGPDASSDASPDTGVASDASQLDSLEDSGAVDGPAPGCPPTLTVGPKLPVVPCEIGLLGTMCDYGYQQCTCHTASGIVWECVPATCPSEVLQRQTPPGPCATAWQACEVFENKCICVAPEMVWACRGGAQVCPDLLPTPGTVCSWDSQYGPECTYQTDGGVKICRCDGYHFSCHP